MSSIHRGSPPPARVTTHAELVAYNKALNSLPSEFERARLRAEVRLGNVARVKARKASGQ